jgi:hypothetical protein
LQTLSSQGFSKLILSKIPLVLYTQACKRQNHSE